MFSYKQKVLIGFFAHYQKYFLSATNKSLLTSVSRKKRVVLIRSRIAERRLHDHFRFASLVYKPHTCIYTTRNNPSGRNQKWRWSKRQKHYGVINIGQQRRLHLQPTGVRNAFCVGTMWRDEFPKQEHYWKLSFVDTRLYETRPSSARDFRSRFQV